MKGNMLLVLAALCCFAGPALAGPEEEAVRDVLHSSFDRPEAKLQVEPVVVAGDHAIAGWVQGDLGGRALLRRRHSRWEIVLCSGDGIKSAPALQQAGVPGEAASKLAAELQAAEQKLPQATLAMFSKFEGTLVMGGTDGHKHP